MPGANFDLLWPLLDVTTTLDPHLMPAYRFGAIFLSEPGEVGAGRPDLAIELVKRGIAANPSEWRLDTDLGFLYYWRVKDYQNAAAAYLQASKNPEAPAVGEIYGRAHRAKRRVHRNVAHDLERVVRIDERPEHQKNRRRTTEGSEGPG